MENEVVNEARVLVFPYPCARCVDTTGSKGSGYILDVLKKKSMVRVAWDNSGIQVVSSQSIKPDTSLAR